MKDKETQIKEIKQIIDERCEAELGQVHATSMSGKVIKTVSTKLLAKDIYEYLIKDSMVLTKEELIERYRQEHQWASKETAREIKNKFRELLSQYCEKMSRDFAFKILDETFKQLGVEVE